MLLSVEDLEKSTVMHPEIAEALAKINFKNSDPRDYQLTRKFMSVMELENFKPAPHGLTESTLEIEMRDGFKSTIKIIRPQDAAPGSLVVLFFGGGFVAGGYGQLVRVGRNLAQAFGATVVCPSYRLGPEHKFPAAQHDAWDTMKWVADNASGEPLHANPEQHFLVGGVSAGANLAASLSRIFQAEPLKHRITGQWLCVPSLIGDNVPEKYKSVYLSKQQCADAPFLTKASLAINAEYTQADPTSPLRWPVTSQNPASGQPKTYFQVDGLDPLRDDGLIYDEILKEAGVDTMLDFYPGCPHGHFAGFRGTKVASDANIDVLVGFGWLLDQALSRDQAEKLLKESGVVSTAS